VEVKERRNQRIDFSAYQTFNWLPETGAPTGNPRLDHPAWAVAIVEAADRTLTGRGLTRDFVNEPHLWFTYHLAIRTKARADGSVLGNRDTEPGGGKEFYSGRKLGDQWRRVTEYEIGTLTLEAMDALSRQIVWRATAEARFKPDLDLDERVSRILRVARELAGRFPRR